MGVINQSVFETTKNNYFSDSESQKKGYSTIPLNKDINNNNIFHFGNYKFELDDKKLFLDAYKKVLIKNENITKRSKTMNSNLNNNWIEFRYHHPGKYREFNYKLGGENSKREEIFMAWSCCNNTDKNAKGCQRVKINRHKWNLDNA